MVRFCGMMPSAEVKKQITFVDDYGLPVIIQAGPNGWTVLYADYSSKYLDELGSTEENFKKAYKVANDDVGPLCRKTKRGHSV